MTGQPAELELSDGGARAKPRRKREPEAEMASPSAKGTAVGQGGAAEEPALMTPDSKKRPGKDRHSVHAIADDYVPRSLPGRALHRTTKLGCLHDPYP